LIPDQEDIVLQLRFWGEQVKKHNGKTVPRVLIEAAKEIERVRAELARKEAKDGQATDG
jgi:hypothetical protein